MVMLVYQRLNASRPAKTPWMECTSDLAEISEIVQPGEHGFQTSMYVYVDDIHKL